MIVLIILANSKGVWWGDVVSRRAISILRAYTFETCSLQIVPDTWIPLTSWVKKYVAVRK